MAETSEGRLIVLMGPSCAGKSPLVKALARFHPDLHGALRPLVLYNDRAPRPGERDGEDYHFRRRDEIDALRQEERYVVMTVRSDLQALDVEELKDTLAEGDVLFEGNPMAGEVLLTDRRFEAVPRRSLFLAPLSRAEILFLREPARHVDLPGTVTDLMRRKLLRRTRLQKGEFGLDALEDIETRAGSAYGELRKAHLCDYVLPNHDGEDHDHWAQTPYPLGDAKRSLDAFAAMLRGESHEALETWEANLLPEAGSACRH